MGSMRCPVPGAFFGLSLLCGLLLYIYFCFMLMKIANRTQTPDAWMAWVPILNFVLMCRVRSAPELVGDSDAHSAGQSDRLHRDLDGHRRGLRQGQLDRAAHHRARHRTLDARLPRVLGGPKRATSSADRPTADAAPQKACGARPTNCSSCGAGVTADDAFCGSCGQAIPMAAPSVAPAPRRGQSCPYLVAGGAAAVLVMVVVGFFGLKMLVGGSGRHWSVSDPVPTYDSLKDRRQ